MKFYNKKQLKSNSGSVYVYILFLGVTVFSLLVILLRITLLSASISSIKVSNANLHPIARGGIDIGILAINESLQNNIEQILHGVTNSIQNININNHTYFNLLSHRFYLDNNLFSSIFLNNALNYINHPNIIHENRNYKANIKISHNSDWNRLQIVSTSTGYGLVQTITLVAILELFSYANFIVHEIFQWANVPSAFLQPKSELADTSSIINSSIILNEYRWSSDHPLLYISSDYYYLYMDNFYYNGHLPTAIIHSGHGVLQINTGSTNFFKGIIISNGSILFNNESIIEGFVIASSYIKTLDGETLFIENRDIIFEINFYNRSDKRKFLDLISLTNFDQSTNVLGELSISNNSPIEIQLLSPFFAGVYFIYQRFN